MYTVCEHPRATQVVRKTSDTRRRLECRHQIRSRREQLTAKQQEPRGVNIAPAPPSPERTFVTSRDMRLHSEACTSLNMLERHCCASPSPGRPRPRCKPTP